MAVTGLIAHLIRPRLASVHFPRNLHHRCQITLNPILSCCPKLDVGTAGLHCQACVSNQAGHRACGIRNRYRSCCRSGFVAALILNHVLDLISPRGTGVYIPVLEQATAHSAVHVVRNRNTRIHKLIPGLEVYRRIPLHCYDGSNIVLYNHYSNHLGSGVPLQVLDIIDDLVGSGLIHVHGVVNHNSAGYITIDTVLCGCPGIDILDTTIHHDRRCSGQKKNR